MKYIITSSLNADNIIATESISPQVFYPQREFGYKTFYSIEQIPYQNCLILFSEIPSFIIDDRDKYNFPMVVEIDDDEQLSEVVKVYDYNGCSVFAYNRSIHLSPFNCKLLFFSDKARVLTRQNCLDSKMSKLVEYFEFKIIVPSQYNLESIVININNEILPKAFNTNENQHDRVKGFIYGFYIGKTKSLPSNIARMLTIQKRIYDIVASILNNGGRSNSTFDEELNRLDSEYSKLDPNRKELKESWRNYVKGKGILIDNLEELLRDLGKERDIKLCFCQKKGIKVRKGLKEYANWDLANYNKEIESYTRSIISKYRTSDVSICSDLDIAPDFSSGMLSGTDEISMLFNKVLARIIWDNVLSGTDELRINRFDVATKITQTIKSIFEDMGKKWNGSNEQLYFHHLRQNIQSFTPFSPTESSNIVLQSLAAFILKGEDFDALLNYLECNSISTYQYALAFWGITTGYVRISRSVISSNLSKSELSTLYSYAQMLLYGKSCSQTLVSTTRSEDSILIQEESPKPIDSPNTYGLAEKVEAIIEAHPKAKLSEKDKEVISRALNSVQNEIAFIDMIGNEMDNLKSGIFPFLKKDLHPKWKQTKKKKTIVEHKNVPKEVNLFGTIVDGISSVVDKVFPNSHKIQFGFANINEILQLIKSANFSISDQTIVALNEDLKWVLDPKYSEHKTQDELIQIFKQHIIDGKTLKRSSKGKDMTWKNKLYADLDVDEIIKLIQINCI